MNDDDEMSDLTRNSGSDASYLPGEEDAADDGDEGDERTLRTQESRRVVAEFRPPQPIYVENRLRQIRRRTNEESLRRRRARRERRRRRPLGIRRREGQPIPRIQPVNVDHGVPGNNAANPIYIDGPAVPRSYVTQQTGDSTGEK